MILPSRLKNYNSMDVVWRSYYITEFQANHDTQAQRLKDIYRHYLWNLRFQFSRTAKRWIWWSSSPYSESGLFDKWLCNKHELFEHVIPCKVESGWPSVHSTFCWRAARQLRPVLHPVFRLLAELWIKSTSKEIISLKIAAFLYVYGNNVLPKWNKSRSNKKKYI